MTSPFEISFTVPGNPQARQAHEVAVHGGRINVYLPKKSSDFQNRVAAYGLQAMRKEKFNKPFDCVVALEAVFVFPAPKSLGREQRKLIEAGELLVWKSKRNDFGNTLKNLEDGLQKSVITNDGLIIDCVLSKRIGKVPCTIITIRTIADPSYNLGLASAKMFALQRGSENLFARQGGRKS